MLVKRSFTLIALFLIVACSHSTPSTDSSTTDRARVGSPTTKADSSAANFTCDQRSKELQEIVKADQDDRKNFLSFKLEDYVAMGKRDNERRKQVAIIFAEGCFKTAADYSAAALVFQHGKTPDHFYQTFIWSQRAVELGDPNQKRMMALAIDRYLVNTNRKSLFASQSAKINLDDKCWCLEPVETSFPDKLRKEYTGKNYREALDWVKSLSPDSTCPAKECQRDFKPTAKGSVPGVW